MMNCLKVEEHLSEYMEAGLPAAEMKQMEMHLKECTDCSELLDAMQHTVSLCLDFPEMEMSSHLVDRILVRTSKRQKSMSVFERFRRFFIQPLLAPRFAVGTALTVVFIILLVSPMLPSRSPSGSRDGSSAYPSRIYSFMDRSLQNIYGKGLKAYDMKNDWQAEFTYLKSTVIHRLQFMMERFDTPAEETNTPVKQDWQEKDTPEEKYSSLPLVSV